jgi:hypothetical protein
MSGDDDFQMICCMLSVFACGAIIAGALAEPPPSNAPSTSHFTSCVRKSKNKFR